LQHLPHCNVHYGSITTETFCAALLGLEDLSLRVTAAALHVAANPEKHPRLRLMLAEVPEVMQCCEERGEQGTFNYIFKREQGTGGTNNYPPVKT